jgi:uncharacterized protein (TIGR03067 family)
MQRSAVVGLVLGVLIAGTTALWAADNDQEAAIKEDREKMEGNWTVASLVMNGTKVPEGELKKLKIIIAADGKWTVLNDGETIITTTTKIDPTKSPKTVDMKFVTGDLQGKSALGIYEVTDDTIKYCRAAPGKDRPTDFSAKEGSEHILAVYQREKTK